MPPSSTYTRPPLPTSSVRTSEADLFDLTGLSLELILVILDQVVESGGGLSPLGVARLRSGIAHALGGDAPMDLAPGTRDATAELASGLTPEEVRLLRNSLAGVLCAAPITLF